MLFFLPSSAKQRRQMTNSTLSREREPIGLFFFISISKLSLCFRSSFVIVLTVINKVKSDFKKLLRLNMKWQLLLMRNRITVRELSRSSNYAELGHSTLLFCRGRLRMYKDLWRTCTAIDLLIKFFLWWRSRCRRRHRLFTLLNHFKVLRAS